jgi:hypothetical protein
MAGPDFSTLIAQISGWLRDVSKLPDMDRRQALRQASEWIDQATVSDIQRRTAMGLLNRANETFSAVPQFVSGYLHCDEVKLPLPHDAPSSVAVERWGKMIEEAGRQAAEMRKVAQDAMALPGYVIREKSDDIRVVDGQFAGFCAKCGPSPTWPCRVCEPEHFADTPVIVEDNNQ